MSEHTLSSIPDRRVVVIGGGITGLACAFQLQRLSATAQAWCDVTILEGSHRIGGKLLTEHVDGFIVDAGADVFMARKKGAIDLCQALQISDRLLETDPTTRKTFIRRDGVLDQITMYENEPLVTLPNGMQELAETTARALSEGTVQYGELVSTIERDKKEYHIKASSGRTYSADAVVIATPAQQTANLLNPLLSDTHRFFAGVSYTKTTTVSAGYRAEDVPYPLDGYGYIIQNAPIGSVSACTWSSSKIRGRAPDGNVLLRAFVRGTDLPSDEMHALVFEEFWNTLGITMPPLFVRDFRWPEAIPVYAKDHGQRIAELEQQLAPLSGLTIAGSAIGAPGIPDSVRSGMQAAEAVWEYVQTKHWSAPHLREDAATVAEAQSFFAR